MKALLLLLGRVRAFVVRDFQLAVSYRLEFFMRILSILFVTTTLFFISQIFASTFSTPYEQWRDPFLAWITALPFLNYFMVGFSSLATARRISQSGMIRKYPPPATGILSRPTARVARGISMICNPFRS